MSNRRDTNRRNWNARGGNQPQRDDSDDSASPPQPPGGNGGENGGGNEPHANPTNNSTQRTMEMLTGALVLVAVVQAVVSCGQWSVAQNALWDTQTPNFQLLFDTGGIRGDGRAGPYMARIVNSGHATLFNGKVWTRAAFVRTDYPMAVWNSMTFRDSIVLGPKDVDLFPIGLAHLDTDQMNLLFGGSWAIMVAIKVEFADTGGRMHHRYLCARWFNKDGSFQNGTVCPTPPQD